MIRANTPEMPQPSSSTIESALMTEDLNRMLSFVKIHSAMSGVIFQRTISHALFILEKEKVGRTTNLHPSTLLLDWRLIALVIVQLLALYHPQ